MTAPVPANESERLIALHQHDILDTPPQQEFDDLVRLAAHICGTPIAAVSLIDADRQWFKSILGLNVQETPRDVAFCAHTILQDDVLIVPDAYADPRFIDNPLVTSDPNIRFYAGAPLVTEDGHALGSLCVIDRTPRTLTHEQETTLSLLARQVSSHLRATRRIAERERLVAERERAEAALVAEREFSNALLETLQEGIVACDANGMLTRFNGATRQFHDQPEQSLPPERWAEHFNIYQADGLTPMRTQDIPLFRALQGEVVRNAELVIAPESSPARILLASGQAIYGAGGEKLGAVVAMHDVTNQRQVERELVRLAAIVESSEEAILAATLDGTLVSWNAGAERLYGYSAAEMIGRHASVLAGPDQESPVPKTVIRILRGETVEPIEVARIRKDGTEFYAALSFSPIRDAAGQTVGLSCIARDITERHQAAEELRQSQARLAEAQRVAQIGSWEYDIATEKITWSDELFRLFEMDPTYGSPSVDSLMAHYHPEDVPMHIRVSEQAMQDGLPYEFDIRILRHDGSVRWAHAVGRGERGASGRIARLFGTLMDIHERKLAEERFRVLFEQSSHAHLLCGGGKIMDCNTATLSLMGCSDKAQILPLHPAALSPEFQPDGSRSDEKGFAMETLAFEHGSHRFEWTHRKMNGEEFPAEVTLTPVILADGPVMLAVLNDLTDRKRAEEQIRDHAVVLEFQTVQLQATNAQLEEANAQLENLAMTDGLTGLKNHRTFQERLAEEVSRAARYNTPLSLVLLDVDKFKQYNDAHGHPAGDAVLRAVASILRSAARDTDIVARYGGEEFVLILPQTDLEGATIFAERLRAAIERHEWPVRAVTASFGVASLRPLDEGGAEMVVRADNALYQAKASGRNCVTSDGTVNADTKALPHDYEPHERLVVPEALGFVVADTQAKLSEMEASAEAVFISDLNGTILQVNARACELLGYAASELTGISGYTLLHPEDIERQGWRMDDVAADHLVVTERRVRRKDGTWLQAELRTQKQADGTAECVLREIAFNAGDKYGLSENRLLQEAGEGFSMLDALVAAVDNKDRYTRRHCEDVAVYALMIARGLGLDGATRDTIAAAALVHDVGKIGVPDDILRKPGTLTEEEFAAVKRHPQMGAAIVSAVPGLQDTLAAVRHHHERWDGDGYPFGLRGVAIPLLARLMAVADAFSAMTTDRPYRKGMDRDKAISILADGAGTQWDPDCVRELMQAVRITEEIVQAK